MHVVVVGCGRLGAQLAHEMSERGHSVAVIDRRAEAFERLRPDFTGAVIPGIGFDRERLVSAGIERADAVAAVTSGDNSNIVIARLAREAFGVGRVVARINDPRRATIFQRLGIDTVAPSQWAAHQVLRRVITGADHVEWTDPTGGVSLIERRLGRDWVGRRIDALEADGARVVAIGRMGRTLVPTPDLTVQDGDLFYMALAAASGSDSVELTETGAQPS